MGGAMGYVQKRVGRDGKPRYTAVYHDLRGERRSAGTFSSKKDANAAWQRAEAKAAEGRFNDLRCGRQTFHRYVTEEWLPHHVMEPTTREAHTYQINKHILPWFGPMRTLLRVTGVTPLAWSSSPLAAFAGLSVGLLVVKMNRQRTVAQQRHPGLRAALVLAAPPIPAAEPVRPPEDMGAQGPGGPDPRVLHDARAILHNASARGERLSQRGLARALRCRGPYCVYADEAVRQLASHGFRALRLTDGFPEWKRAGLPVAAKNGG
jgi:hypothetical protein